MWLSDLCMTKDEAGAMLQAFLSPTCVEIVFVGRAAEAMHDLVDGIVEDMATFVATSSPSRGETLDDTCNYFLRGASLPPLLIAAVGESPELERLLEKMARA